jgi:phosphoribosyl-AMP cyclohydrolase
MGNDWPNMVKWSAERLVPLVAQDAQDGTILMVTWMNRVYDHWVAVEPVLKNPDAIHGKQTD